MPNILQVPKPPALPQFLWYYDQSGITYYAYLVFPEPMDTTAPLTGVYLEVRNQGFGVRTLHDAEWKNETVLMASFEDVFTPMGETTLTYMPNPNHLKTAAGYEYPEFEVVGEEIEGILE